MKTQRELGARIVELERALTELSEMYTHAWDLTDGGLIMMGPSVARFETAHANARRALGFNDLELEDED